jgi:hypothetical protein
MHQRLHIESTLIDGPTTEVDQDMDEQINIFLKTKNQKKKVIVYIMRKIMETYFDNKTYRCIMCQSMHIESTPMEGPTTKADQNMDEPNNRFLKTKKQKRSDCIYYEKHVQWKHILTIKYINIYYLLLPSYGCML